MERMLCYDRLTFMKTVLVTGGAGFIGSHIVDKLIEKNHTVIVVDNLVSGNRKNLPKDVAFIKADIQNSGELENIFKTNTIDTVFHLAGQPSIVNSFADPYTDVNTNFVGTINVLMAAQKYHVKRFVFASSMTIYGNAKDIPITEDSPAVPINYYGVAKFAAERFLHITAQRIDIENPIKVTSLRMFNVYGSRQSLTNPYQGVLAIFIGNVLRNEPISIFGDGKQSRDFVFVEDVAQTWVDCIDNEKSFGEVLNIGYGKKTTITSLAKAVVKACGQDPLTYPIHYKPQRPGDQHDIAADISRAKEILGFDPKISLEEGLKHTLTWAKQNS